MELFGLMDQGGRKFASESRKTAKYQRFGLTLVVNHACNLRCSYCYTGAKFNRPMPDAVGDRAIERAITSVEAGGELELGFFGGEPMLEADRIERWIGRARERCRAAGRGLTFGLTTNGTLSGEIAWRVMTDPGMELAISCDGRPETHDRHRVFPDGRGSSTHVMETMRRLRIAGKPFRTVLVVRPDTVTGLPEHLSWLRDIGVEMVDLSLDLWTDWGAQDLENLRQAIRDSIRDWRGRCHGFGVNWFNEKLGRLAGARVSKETARCGFGAGEIAVAPSGRLYPCERLVGDDTANSPVRLPGTALEGSDFLSIRTFPGRSEAACSGCAIESECSTTCRCSNYVRTGDVSRPDGLLCFLDRTLFRETLAALADGLPRSSENPQTSEIHEERSQQ